MNPHGLTHYIGTLIALAAFAAAPALGQTKPVTSTAPASAPAARILPIPFPARAADPAGATLLSDPIPTLITTTILQAHPVPRTTPLGFVKLTIPDPDDRANMPRVPATPALLPLTPPPPASTPSPK